MVHECTSASNSRFFSFFVVLDEKPLGIWGLKFSEVNSLKNTYYHNEGIKIASVLMPSFLSKFGKMRGKCRKKCLENLYIIESR